MAKLNPKFLTRRTAVMGALTLSALFANRVFAQIAPIKIGFSISQTGPLGAGGKAGLLGLQIWRDDINEKGGILGRKVELVVYDDQSNASLVPGIYAKLLDLDKVDLLISPYGTNLTVPIMSMVKERGLLLMGNYGFEVNERAQHDLWFNNSPLTDAGAIAKGFFEVGKKTGAKKVAFLASDAEFAQTLVVGGRNQAKLMGMDVVYDQKYPPNTTDFSSIVRAIKATKPDLVYVCSYPSESVGIVRSANEIGVGDSVKLFGGGMVGLQFAPIMESMGSQLNGIVNYNPYVPEKSLDFPGLKEFLARYTVKAKAEKIDPLGFYLPPFSYAIGQVLEHAITETKGLDQKKLGKYIRENEHKTIVGSIKYQRNGEWAEGRALMIQFRDIKDKDMEQFRQAGKQIILAPEKYKSGELKFPFEQARN